MKLISLIQEMKNKFSGQVLFDQSLSKYSWFNLGGPAKVIFRPKNLNELSIFLKQMKGFNKIKVLGIGSNTVIRDGGFNGIIIRFGKSFSHLTLFDHNTIIAGASALDKNVSDFALRSSLAGFEFLSCIPGTIGGGVRMNAGCYGNDISKILVSVQVMDFSGKMKVIYSQDIKFSYRGSSLDNNLIERKKKDQPSKIKTCGSTFKNPDNNKAWKLIKDSGCAGMSLGDAYISEKHCNFFVNRGNAKSEHLENLINQVKEQVLNKTGINLELELQIIGEKL